MIGRGDEPLTSYTYSIAHYINLVKGVLTLIYCLIAPSLGYPQVANSTPFDRLSVGCILVVCNYYFAINKKPPFGGFLSTLRSLLSCTSMIRRRRPKVKGVMHTASMKQDAVKRTCEMLGNPCAPTRSSYLHNGLTYQTTL